MQNISPDTAMTLLHASQMQASQGQDLSLVQTKDDEKLSEIARDFEAVFLSEMVKPMFAGIETDGMFGGGQGEDVFKNMMITEYGKTLAERDITGIQTQVKNKLIEMQADRTERENSPALQSGVIQDLEITEHPISHKDDTKK